MTKNKQYKAQIEDVFNAKPSCSISPEPENIIIVPNLTPGDYKSPLIKERCRYYSFTHEVGHIFGGHKPRSMLMGMCFEDRVGKERVLIEESLAWYYARFMVEDKYIKEIDAFAFMCLKSYFVGIGQETNFTLSKMIRISRRGMEIE